MAFKLSDFIVKGYKGAGIVLICGNEVLMQLRRHPPVWSFVGGGFDEEKDSDFVDCAIREFWEETGIELQRSQISAKPIHVLGFGRYCWKLYLCFVDRKQDPRHAPVQYRCEYEKYRYVNLYNYKSELKEEKHNKLYPFVSFQMWKIRRYIEKYKK